MAYNHKFRFVQMAGRYFLYFFFLPLSSRTMFRDGPSGHAFEFLDSAFFGYIYSDKVKFS